MDQIAFAAVAAPSPQLAATMITNHPSTTPDRTDRYEPRDRDLLEESPSTGWEDLCDLLSVDTDVEPPSDAIDAARRSDRPLRYRRKHALEVTT